MFIYHNKKPPQCPGGGCFIQSINWVEWVGNVGLRDGRVWFLFKTPPAAHNPTDAATIDAE
ncbi:hypothetical protein CKO09_02880 [Chromatium weissei]|nr:hypothetical protein [Chromatium weissei]